MSTNRPQRPPRLVDDGREPRQQRATRTERPVRETETEARPVRQRQQRPENRQVRTSERPVRSERMVREERVERPSRQINMPAVDFSGVDLSASALQKGVAELIGTFMLVFFGVGAALGTAGGTGYIIGFGTGLMAIVYALGHISGAHVNPAVTIALTLTGNFKAALAPIYIVAQFIGAILAALTLKLVYGDELGLGYTQLAEGLGTWKGFAMEMIATAVFVFVIHAVATDKRAPAAVSGLAIGGTLMVIQVMLGMFTGASVNPARSFGPALIGNEWGDLWIYFLAPIIGAIIGGFLWEAVGRDGLDSMPEEHPVESIR